MKSFLLVLSVLCVLAAFGMFAASIWVGDLRWCGTGFLTAALAYGGFAWAADTPRHEDICGGC